jgi:hypothetical protein
VVVVEVVVDSYDANHALVWACEGHAVRVPRPILQIESLVADFVDFVVDF